MVKTGSILAQRLADKKAKEAAQEDPKPYASFQEKKRKRDEEKNNTTNHEPAITGLGTNSRHARALLKSGARNRKSDSSDDDSSDEVKRAPQKKAPVPKKSLPLAFAVWRDRRKRNMLVMLVMLLMMMIAVAR